MKKLHKIIIIFFMLWHTTAWSDISGKVFQDFNANGKFDSETNFNEVGVAGITVTAFDKNGTQNATTLSNQVGDYTLTGLTSGESYRLEFTWSDKWFEPGAGGGTSVQFVKDGTTNVDASVVDPVTYNTGISSALLFTPIMTNGDPMAGGDAAQKRWFAGYPYGSIGNTTPTLTLTGERTGALWGTAYSKQANRVFAAAFIRRHSGLGPMGSGGIYMLEPTASSFNVTAFFDMDNNSFNTTANPSRTRADNTAPQYGNYSSYIIVNDTSLTWQGSIDPLTDKPSGLGVVGSNVERGLPASVTTSNYDPAAFEQVGKVGLGDLDISDDGQYLFVTNLYQRKIFRLTLDNPKTPTKVTAVDSWNLPVMTVTQGVLRPFALKYYRGDVYVGAVSSGENGGNNTVNGSTDLYAYVFKLNQASGVATFTATPVLQFPLNYRKSFALNEDTSGSAQFYPWINNTSTAPVIVNAYGNHLSSYPTPMLSNIKFTHNGDMVLGLSDRTGYQFGYNNYYALSTKTDPIDYRTSGDVLIAGYQNGNFILENGGNYTSANGTTYSGALNNGGPGGGELFASEGMVGGSTELAQGAIAYLMGQNEIVSTLQDPLSTGVTGFWAGGIRYMDLTKAEAISRSNALNRSYELFDPSTGIGKANGLGDLDLITPLSPTEIGNRVWLDTNKNGIQDADEAGIDNVTVSLDCGTGQATTTITANGGNYLFTNAAGGNATFMQPPMTCTVSIDPTQTALSTYQLTTQDADSHSDNNALTDLRDSDAILSKDHADIIVDVPYAGANNHSLDFGFAEGVSLSVDLTLSKTVLPAQTKRGDTATYTIVVTNEGTGVATNVQVADVLSDQVTYLSDNLGTYDPVSGIWTVGSLDAGLSQTLMINVKVK